MVKSPEDGDPVNVLMTLPRYYHWSRSPIMVGFLSITS